MNNENTIVHDGQDNIPSFSKMQISLPELDEKLTKFSELELSGQNTFTAIKTMLNDERVKNPPWVRFFAMYGLLMFRRGVLKGGNQ